MKAERWAGSWEVGEVHRNGSLSGETPTVLRRMLGLRLKEMRQRVGLTQAKAGEGIYASGSKVSRMESGQGSFAASDVIRLLEIYGVADPEEHDRYLELIELGEQPGWWHRDSDALPKGFELRCLEPEARTIRCYEPTAVPELLQTPRYAEATLRRKHPNCSEAEIKRLLELRIQRQQILAGEKPPYLWILVEESALRTPIGGRAVWRDQIEQLHLAARADHIVIQIVGEDVRGPVIAGGGFVYLRFIERRLPDVVCVSQLTSMLYFEGRSDIDSYLAIVNHLAVEAMRPAESIEWLRALC